MYAMPCQALQRFLFRPASQPDGPAPNTVIASQDSCPDNMTLEEYKEFCILPLGHHIQWANILLELAMPSLDFKKPETTLLLLQCIYQTGPPDPAPTPTGFASPTDEFHKSKRSTGFWGKTQSTTPACLPLSDSCDAPVGTASARSATVLRESHDFFRSDEKTHALLQCLTEALQRVKENWESSQALFTFVAIAARTLSLSACPTLQKCCLAFLATARDIAKGWVLSLKDKAHEAEDHNDRTHFIAKSVEVALICTSTFDVDDQHLGKILAVPGDASIFVQNAIVVQEREQSQPSKPEQHLAILDMHHKRLLHRCYKFIARHPAELDATRKSWSTYVPGNSGWRTVSDHWLTTDTLATQAVSANVHYNLLRGELLVNGLPLDQAPQSYRCQSLYSTLFGKAFVDAMPSTTAGFQFSAKRAFHGWSVQLGLSPDGDLIVRANKGTSTYETIPSRLVEGKYPSSFVHDHIHWLDIARNTIQFRPVHEPWNTTSSAVWTLFRASPSYNPLLDSIPQESGREAHTQWQLAKGDSSVVSLDSSTSLRISHVLDPLANAARIHCILQPFAGTDTLHINIPTLRLSFTLARHSSLLESKEFRSMAVDASQSLGTLVGLRSKIMLKHLTRDDRIVLIPESNVIAHHRHNSHVAVTVSKYTIHKVHAVHVDPMLGRLLDNGDLTCKLYLAYLHALTSSCLLDPLTNRTGTEQALTILKYAAVR